jgi:hypothetical protein
MKFHILMAGERMLDEALSQAEARVCESGNQTAHKAVC